MLLEEDFEWQIDVPQSLDQEALSVPTLLIQPFVENALKHGLRHKKGLKKLFIKLVILNPQRLCVVIEDNGVGRKRAQEINNKNQDRHQSFATKNIQNRIDLLNKNTHLQLQTQTIDLYDANQNPIGTRIVLHLTLPEAINLLHKD
jgi:sensor histidine kinase YesM